MPIAKNFWLNHLATKLSIKDKTFGHLLSSKKIKESNSFFKKIRINKKIKSNNSSLKSGSILILISKKYYGKKVVLINTTESNLLVVTGPFAMSGVSMRRINKKYAIFSGAQINLGDKNEFSLNKRNQILNDNYFETLKKCKNNNFNTKNYSYVLSHRIKQNFIDKIIADKIKDDFFIKAYLRTKILFLQSH